ncbi:hypothetical protein QVD17_08712 [Tagetes erecta]|uniref:Uncharacterized protein n=1 Tax=Tagetes erecta TaxID=13708 RepID=A0AAD8L373_TARER|nr:hypothetical protein QVD17_08712 [Tagetes erecta]
MIQKGQACREEAKSKETSSEIPGSKRKGKNESDKVSKAEVKREMGKKQKVDSSKGYYSLQENMEIKCIKGSVKVDSEAIHLLLGLPNKGLDLVAEKKPSEWTKLGQAWRQSKCKIGMMDHITDEKDIANIDWCGYIVSKIKKSKENWKSGVLDDHISGALTILTLLYVDGTYINGNNEQRTNSPLVDEDSDCSDTEDEDSDYSVDILEAPGVESDLKKIKTIFQWMMGQKKRVEKLALKAYKSYSGNAEVEEVIQKFNECFKTGINLSEMEAEKEIDEVSIPFANGRS